MNYESLDLEIIKFEAEDIIVTSGEGGDDGNNDTYNDTP